MEDDIITEIINELNVIKNGDLFTIAQAVQTQLQQTNNNIDYLITKLEGMRPPPPEERD